MARFKLVCSCFIKNAPRLGCRTFETRTETLMARVSGQSVEELVKDLKIVRKENKGMAERLKGAK